MLRTFWKTMWTVIRSVVLHIQVCSLLIAIVSSIIQMKYTLSRVFVMPFFNFLPCDILFNQEYLFNLSFQISYFSVILTNFFLNFWQEDFDEFSDVDELYITLPLDKVESLEDLVAIGPPSLVKVIIYYFILSHSMYFLISNIQLKFERYFLSCCHVHFLKRLI